MNIFAHTSEPVTLHVMQPIAYATEERTYVVYGCPRGGTTMVAAVLDALGVDMGPMKDGSYDFEDKHITDGNITTSDLYAYLNERNQQHTVWGFKDPMLASVHRKDHKLFGALRNPVVLAVLRDIPANANALLQADALLEGDPVPYYEWLLRLVTWQSRIINMCINGKYPACLISYDKARTNKDLFVGQLTSFLGMPHDDYSHAADRISKTGGYLQP